ncbi:5-formyltetrahydrofolate cyclo-ligase [Pseudoalteromonas ulvae]|uniref:5-formyltetrahydrofolate cyclo-ligase n=1 Tax=Pseudoalteromonas ulvae TaxID=107327 RepID=UPI00186BB144|nr:5-formyltetrahydrofolate cyclo-ligase [Pseudoalteromonas ulvae]
MNRAQIRELVRKKRNSLTKKQQQEAENALNLNLIQQLKHYKNAKIALYLTNDGELGTNKLIQSLRTLNHQVYLPVIHPFSAGYLLFQLHEENSPMSTNRYGIFEPKLNCSQICPIEQLDILFTPLVAFDAQGNRLGMGGGFYDRTLAKYYQEQWQKPIVIGLAHECQKVDLVPTEAWDIPLKWIATPEFNYRW